MSVIMTYLFVFYVFVTTKIRCGSAWSNWKCDFRLPLHSPFAIFA